MNQFVPTSDYIKILPELVLTAFGIAVMMIDPLMKPGASRRSLGWLSFAGTLAAVGAAVYQAGHPGVGWFGTVRVDTFSVFFHILIPAISAVCILASFEYLDAQNIRSGEYYGLILF